MPRRSGEGPAPPKRMPPDPSDVALRLLGRREHSAAELRERLRRKGYPREEIERTLSRLAEAGLQDDRRFAEMFAAEAAARRGMSASAIRGELRKRGVDKETAAGSAAATPEAEEERARAIAGRRAAALASYPPDVRLRRLTAFLARRGHSPDISSRVAAEALDALGTDAGPREP